MGFNYGLSKHAHIQAIVYHKDIFMKKGRNSMNLKECIIQIKLMNKITVTWRSGINKKILVHV